MHNVVQFIPRADKTANENLSSFVSHCKNRLTAFGADLPFDAHTWEITRSVDTPGKYHAVRLYFCTWESARSTPAASNAERQPMAEPFASFAKAYLRYQQTFRPTSGQSERMAALRVLEQALLETGDASPVRISPEVLNRACQLLLDFNSPNTAYNDARQLQRLSAFVSEHRLVIAPTQWSNWVPNPRDNASRVGQEFDERRQDKLLSPAAFHALGQIFNLASESQDILVTSVCALLCAAPSRISEVMRLPVDCEVTQRDKTNNLDVLALRWWPVKGAPPMLKHVVPSMEDVVREALKKLREISESGRELARWYEKNPKRMFIPPELQHLRSKKLLSMRELDSLVFESERYYNGRPFDWCNDMNLNTTKIKHKLHVPFEDAQKAVLSLLPRNFPFIDVATGLKYSEALFTVKRQLLSITNVTYRCALQPVETGDISTRLGRREELSIFKRFNFTEDDGSPIWLNTHQFRHYLNTLAQAGGLGQLDVAKWSGRVNVSQNRAYDHTSDHDVLARLRDAVREDAGALSPLSRLHKVVLIPRDEFARLRIPTAHTTEYGYCVHDFTMLPCQVHQDCINCNEQACIKGDEVREANIRRARDETRALLARAAEAEQDGDVGADAWVRHQKLTLNRLDNLCNIIDDPSVKPGAVIMLSDITPASRLEQAAQSRALLDVSDGSLRPLLPAPNHPFASVPKRRRKAA